jgi:Ala-tRNA(Pro) deacylase
VSLVTDYLDSRGVPYELLHHEPTTSCVEEAGALHVDVDHVLKAVVIDTRRRHVVVVIPASRRLDIHLVRRALGDPIAHLATEDELQGDFPAIELGGAPILGWVLDAETLVDPTVLDRDTVVFAAGTRTESVRVRTLGLFRGEHAGFARIAAEREPAETNVT